MRRQYTSLKYENTLQNHEYRDDNPEEKKWKWDLVWKHRRNIFENKNMSSKSIVKNEFFQRQGGIFSFLPEKKIVSQSDISLSEFSDVQSHEWKSHTVILSPERDKNHSEKDDACGKRLL